MSKNRKPWRASVQKSNSETVEAKAAPAFDPAKPLRGMARLEFIEAKVRDFYERYDGAPLDLAIRNSRLTLEAFESQMAAMQVKSLADKAWGPEISVAEARLNRSLLERLLRQKLARLRYWRDFVEEALTGEEQAETASEQPRQPATRHPRPSDEAAPHQPAREVAHAETS